MAEANAAGVPCTVGSCSEVYLERAFRDAGFGPADRMPVARDLGETSLMFLVHHTLRSEAIDEAAARIRDVVSAATD